MCFSTSEDPENLPADKCTSKNQVGHQLALDEKEFRLGDIGSQILVIFDKEAKEGQIDLRVQFMNVSTEETKLAVVDQNRDAVEDMVV